MKIFLKEPLFNLPAKFFALTVTLIFILVLNFVGLTFLSIIFYIVPLIIFFGQTGLLADKNDTGKHIYRFYSVFNLKTKSKIDISNFPYIQMISKKQVFQPFVPFRPNALSYDTLKYEIWVLDKVGRKKLLLFGSEHKEKTQKKLSEIVETLDVKYFKSPLKTRRQ